MSKHSNTMTIGWQMKDANTIRWQLHKFVSKYWSSLGGHFKISNFTYHPVAFNIEETEKHTFLLRPFFVKPFANRS